MRVYQCHKRVLAAKIVAAEKHQDGSWTLALDNGNLAGVSSEDAGRFRITEEDQGYYVQYDNNYVSWSPTKAFVEGYSLV